jgi:hypothetical protein
MKNSDLNDDERVKKIMEYLQDKAPQACFNASNCKMQTCHCLSCLDNQDDNCNRNAIALYILWFSELDKQTQQLLLMEKIRSTQLVLDRKRNDNQKLFFLPYKTELVEVAEELGNVLVCKYAMQTLLHYASL